MFEDALLSSPFYIVCGLIAYVFSGFIKSRYKEVTIFNDSLPVLPVLLGLLSGILFNFLLPDVMPFTLSALAAGAKEGILAGLASSKIYEQKKRIAAKEESSNENKEE